MTTLLSIPGIWELLKRFKDWCRAKGWKTCEEADWVRVNHEYHDFVWASNVHSSTFRKVSQNHKCTVFDGLYYRVVNASYVAWIFQQTPSKDFIQTIVEDSSLSERTALYDLSRVYEGKPVCLRLNSTDSQVFREFERFLSETWGVAVESA